MRASASRSERPAPGLPAGEDAEFAAAVLDGLSASPKTLPCRYFYDRRGSELFERICTLSEYYPTRTETAILKRHAAEFADGADAGGVLVEFGSGSSTKTEILLRAMPRLRAYVPVDVSQSALEHARRRLEARFPDLDVRPVLDDFSHGLTFPEELRPCRKIGFFPGSTIGNLQHREALALLRNFRAVLVPGGRLIVGVDLLKDEATLARAYNDASGVTAAFNLNLLARINRTLGSSFDLGAFRHKAWFNEAESRVEMHLVSKRDQTVELLGRRFSLRRGETIHTENSHKYTIAGFQRLAASAGWQPRRVWTDAGRLFSVHELEAD